MDTIKAIAGMRLKPRHEEDFIDRFNYATTPFILAIAAAMIFAKEFGPISEPLSCWSQAEWNDEWLEYAHDYCFVESTYYVPMNQAVPQRGQRNNANDKVSYYQWIPFILFLMALCCRLPNKFWLFCNACSGKQLPNILRQAHDAVGRNNEAKVAAGIGRHLHTMLGTSTWHQRERRGQSCLVAGISWITKRFSRHTLCSFYMIMKGLSLLVNFGLLIFITYFLGADQTPHWGFQIVYALLKYQTAWEHNSLFPRVSLCDFKIRKPGEKFADYTVQCLLVANFLNEKIFLTLYYIFAIMAVVTAYNLASWVWLIYFSSGFGYVDKMVELSAMHIFPDPELSEDLSLALDLEDIADDDMSTGLSSESSAISSLSSTSSFRHHQVSPVNSNATTCTFATNNRGQSVEFNTGQPPLVDQQQPAEQQNDEGPTQQQQENQEQPQTDGQKTEDEIAKWEKKLFQAQNKRADFYKAYRIYKCDFMSMLGTDGILISRLIQINAGSQMASLIMGETFHSFLLSKIDEATEKMEKSNAKQKGLSLAPV